EEFDEMVIDAVRGFYLQGVACRERLGVDKVARKSAPYSRIFLGWRRASRAPQHQERRHDLAILLGHIGLEIDGCIGAIVAAGAENRLFCEAADIVVKHDSRKLRVVASAFQKPFGGNSAYQRVGKWLRLRQEQPVPGVQSRSYVEIGPR